MIFGFVNAFVGPGWGRGRSVQMFKEQFFERKTLNIRTLVNILLTKLSAC